LAKFLGNPDNSLLIAIVDPANLIEASYLVSYITPISIAINITFSSIFTSKYINKSTSNRDLTKRKK
jgi:hypothetical protein